MKIKDLIKVLEGFPKDATIGTIDVEDVRVSDSVHIKNNSYTTYDHNGDDITIKRIEEMRTSNQSKICDYYIV